MADRPNVLMIVADDLNAWIGALARHPDVRTPAIDALAGRGTLFTKAYCAAPYCNASRMSAFTGLMPSTTLVYANEPYWARYRRPPTFFEVLRDHGYQTHGAGKVFHGAFDYGLSGRQAPWRAIENRSFVWDSFREPGSDHLPATRPANGLLTASEFAGAKKNYRVFDWGPIPDADADLLPDAAVTSATTGFLADPPSEPFLWVAGLYKPHLPWYVPNRFFDLYDDDVTLPLVKGDDLDDVPEIGRRWASSPPDHDLVTGRDAWRPAVRAYLAAISYCDDLVGRMLDALASSPAADRTWVVLWGDNGFHLGEKLHWRKFALWEEATRVPLIVVPPGGVPRRVTEPVSLVDLHPTVLDICGARETPPVDGASLLPAVLEGVPRANPAVMTWGRGNHSVRTTDWRLIHYRDGTEELYDHRADPLEWHNLAHDPALSAVADTLRGHLPGR